MAYGIFGQLSLGLLFVVSLKLKSTVLLFQLQPHFFYLPPLE